MVIQAVGLLDDLDKELNNYAMRLREWYGWHFPEVGKILADNLTYAKVVLKMGMRTNAKNIEFGTDLLTPEDEAHIKEAAEISMGSEISSEDELNIKELCNQIIFLSEYRQTLTEYLRTRMMTIAPNLTTMVGELVAARLIAHAGSLISLAKMPGSTIQIFGAEKALFRALKTKSQTPKYGLIYHASIVGQANPKIKGKISRSLASKCALCIRVDALGENTEGEIGKKSKKILESRIAQLESGNSGASIKKGNKIEKYTEDKGNKKGKYNDSNEIILTKKKKKRDNDSDEEEDEKEEKQEKNKKKGKEDKKDIEKFVTELCEILKYDKQKINEQTMKFAEDIEDQEKLKTRKLNRSIRSFIKDRQDELNKIFKQEDMPSDRIVSYDRFMQIFDEVGIKLKKEYMEVLLYQMKVAVTKVRSMHDFNMIVVVDFLK